MIHYVIHVLTVSGKNEKSATEAKEKKSHSNTNGSRFLKVYTSHQLTKFNKRFHRFYHAYLCH